ANCVIWVEGPSDRIYLKHWISSLDPSLLEGIHYSIMFYGGRLASHLSGDDTDTGLESFISLRRLNRRGVIVIDSDKDRPRGRISDTNRWLRDEFNKGPGSAWVTEGREIESYLKPREIAEAIRNTKPSASAISNFSQYENTLAIRTKGGKNEQASKV